MLTFERERQGGGLVNSLIDSLPFELHLSKNYQFCGPGTRLNFRLARGDPGYNELDKACKVHDIAYRDNSDLSKRHAADYELEQSAWKRVLSKDATLKEKAAAYLVTNVMKLKRKMGMGCVSIDGRSSQPQRKRRNIRKKKKTKTTLKQRRGLGCLQNRDQKQNMRKRQGKKKVGGKLSFQSNLVRRIRNALQKRGRSKIKTNSSDGDIYQSAKIALKAARQTLKTLGGRQRIRIPRVIPVPKTGGILPLIPIFAGLSALGSIASSVSGIAKAAHDAKIARKHLEETRRHNKSMENNNNTAVPIINGSGLYLKPYQKGYGLYLASYNNTNKQSKN